MGTPPGERPTKILHHLLSRGPALKVSRTEPDFNNLAWDTLQKLYGSNDSPQAETIIPHLFKIGMTDLPKALTVYVNPMSLVTAGEPTAEFLKRTIHERETWLARLRKVAGGSSRVQQHYGLRAPEVVAPSCVNSNTTAC